MRLQLLKINGSKMFFFETFESGFYTGINFIPGIFGIYFELEIEV